MFAKKRIGVKAGRFAAAAAFVLAGAMALTACGGGTSGGGTDGGSATIEGGSAPAPSGETVVLKLASDAPVEHIATALNEEAAEKIKERTEGRVEVTYYGASQLGGYETVYEEVAAGTIDAAQITVPDTTDARLGAAYLPYYATSFEEAKVLYGTDSFMTQTFAGLTEGDDVKFLGWVLEGFIGMGVVKDPTDVFTPGTAKGIKLRSPAMATFLYVQEDLGYNPITVPYAEVPTAIQTNVVDGWIGGTPNMNYAWVGDVINKMYVNYIHA
ncbi:MAG: TRAP transporter substrate-binding protein DctP, partial [Clostridiales Family XIII bacterium]|nr:TRAP transporter substrate-binding protein DctP [Clostridiales Family XIII bacterium]